MMSVEGSVLESKDDELKKRQRFQAYQSARDRPVSGDRSHSRR